jgi:hypothetical protein
MQSTANPLPRDPTKPDPSYVLCLPALYLGLNMPQPLLHCLPVIDEVQLDVAKSLQLPVNAEPMIEAHARSNGHSTVLHTHVASSPNLILLLEIVFQLVLSLVPGICGAHKLRPLIGHGKIYLVFVPRSPQQNFGNQVRVVEWGPAHHEVALRGGEKLGQNDLPQLVDSGFERAGGGHGR